MSLQVWLPFNRDISNYGLYNTATRSVNSASIATGGKLGNCLSLSSDGQAVSLDSYMDVCSAYTRYSMSAWICVSNPATGHSASILSSGNWNAENGQFCFALYNYSSGGYYKILVPNKVHWSNGIDLSSPIKLNTWYNICITYNGYGTEGYINGEYVGSYAGGGIATSSESKNLYVGSATYHDGFTLKGSINDVRIYDHCLSAKEVKEISKGLICHYKLDNNGFGGENLILESHRVTSGSDASGITSTYMDDGSLKIVSTSGNGNYKSCGFSKYSSSNVGSKLSVGDTYTISLDVKVEEGSSLPTLFINGGNGYKALHPVNGKFVTNNWFRAYYTSTWGEPGTSYGNISLHLGFSSAIGTFYFKNFKLEKGSKPTQWCPSPLDDNTLGLDLTTEVDCSGLSNNGTKIGGLTPSTSPVSVRYESCYNFDGNTGSIQIPNLATLVPSGEFTMNCWIYHDNTWSSKTCETILGGPSGFELNAKKTSTNSPVLWPFSWGQAQAAYELNKWNMITMTRNASETKFYINGELKITGSAGTIPSGNYFIGAWNTSSQQNFKGKISDFRLYSTVLSVEDIKMLYNTSASIDKNGNMHAYEFKEE